VNRHRQAKKQQSALSRGTSKASSFAAADAAAAADQAAVDYLDLPLAARATLGSDDGAAAVAIASADCVRHNTPSATPTSADSTNSSGTRTSSIDQLGMELGIAGMEGIAGIAVDADAAAAADIDTLTGDFAS
jgi:hypothetical protein